MLKLSNIMKQEQVNHPKHYNSNPAGVECITVIRHYVCDIANALKYLWRAGLKTEMGKEDVEKEIEDLRKALWYINDHYDHAVRHTAPMNQEDAHSLFYEQTGILWNLVFRDRPKEIQDAINNLLPVGIIFQGEEYYARDWRDCLKRAHWAINKRIEILKAGNHE